VVTASEDGTARIWNVATGAPIGEPLKHDQVVRSAMLSPDGGRVLTCCAGGAARVWDVSTRAPIGKPLQHESSVLSTSFSSDGTRVLTESAGGVARVWNAATGEAIGKPLQHEIKAFSPDGAQVVITSGTTAQVLDAATGALIGKPLQHDDLVKIASFSPDGALVATTSGKTTLVGCGNRFAGWSTPAARRPRRQRGVQPQWQGRSHRIRKRQKPHMAGVGRGDRCTDRQTSAIAVQRASQERRVE
jgi:WD40 repeat protein